MRFLLPGLLLLLSSLPTAAQPTHAEVLEELAYSCLETLSSVPEDTIALHVEERHAYVRSAAIRLLRERGVTVLVPDSIDTEASRLDVGVEQSRVRLTGGDPLRRAALLSLRYRTSTGGGTVEDERSCTESYEDEIPRALAEQLSSPAFAATSPELPPQRGWTRYLKPVVLGAATLTTALLFFTLRSDG